VFRLFVVGEEAERSTSFHWRFMEDLRRGPEDLPYTSPTLCFRNEATVKSILAEIMQL